MLCLCTRHLAMSAYITCTHGHLHCACRCVLVSQSATPPHRMQCLKAQPDICQHCNADEATDDSRNGACVLAAALVLHGHKEAKSEAHVFTSPSSKIRRARCTNWLHNGQKPCTSKKSLAVILESIQEVRVITSNATQGHLAGHGVVANKAPLGRAALRAQVVSRQLCKRRPARAHAHLSVVLLAHATA